MLLWSFVICLDFASPFALAFVSFSLFLFFVSEFHTTPLFIYYFPCQAEGPSDYINANYVRGFYGPKFIACQVRLSLFVLSHHLVPTSLMLVEYTNPFHTHLPIQGPMNNTVVAFWHMVWQEEAAVVVMAARCEGGKLENGKTLPFLTSSVATQAEYCRYVLVIASCSFFLPLSAARLFPSFPSLSLSPCCLPFLMVSKHPVYTAMKMAA